ncbi:MAG: TonB-dependent receptor [Terracidiphilus sp.]
MAMINLARFSHGFLGAPRRGRAEQGSATAERSPKLGSALLCFLAAVLMICPLIARGQELTATLSGTVTDTTGAVIPHATISVALNGVNAGTRVVESDGAGNYVVTNLTAGTYSVTVTAAGFETFKGKNIVLNVAEKHAFNTQLKAGSLTTTVTVEDNPVAVDTETSGQAGTINGQQVEELEINSRNFEQLITLQPGVVNQLGDEANAGSTAMSVNGARTTANNWTVDGADINDSGSNGTAVNEPSMEAIQEITLERGNYDAGYGRSGGGQVLVATKNGTSSFHGNAYEFVRTTDFNANDYLNKESQIANGQPNTPGVYHQNVYGFTIGGPIYIPKVYNADKKKTFFFWSEDWHKINEAGSSTTLNTPTPNQLLGYYSTPSQLNTTTGVLGPATPPPTTGACLISNTVNTADNSTTGQVSLANGCESMNAALYVSDLYTGSNVSASGTETVNVPAVNDYRDDIVRIDHYFNDKIHFYARGMNDIMPVTEPLGLWAGANFPNVSAADVDSPGKNVVGNLSYAISPTIVNELEFVYAQGTYHSTFIGTPFADSSTALSALAPGTEKYKDPYGRLPAISINGVTGFSAGSTPWKERNLDRTYFDNLAISAGKNTIRFGFQIQQMLKSENAVAGEASFSFNQAYYGFTEFLLGNVSTYTQQNMDTIPDLNYYNREVYAQDDFKLNHKLTLNLGIRWSSFPSATDKNNTLTNFDSQLYSPLAAPVIDPTSGNFVAGQTLANGSPLIPVSYANGIIFPKGASCARAQTYSSQVQCSPFGSTINPNDNANFAPRLGFAYNPDGNGKTSIRGGLGIFYDRLLNGIYEQNAFYDPPVVQSVTVNGGSFDTSGGQQGAVNYGPNLLWTTGTPTFRAPNYADWNLTVEHQLLPTTVISGAWVASESRHLLGEYDGNQPTLAARESAPAGTDVNAIRPYLGYSYMRTKSPIFTSNYNSFQLDLSHRSSKGLTVNVAYTWSKILTTNSNDRGTAATDTYNLKQDYGPATFNTPQMLVFNYVYTLPFYKGQSGAAGRLLGGWELSGITSLISGSNFSVVQNEDPFATTFGGRGLGISVVDPDNASRLTQIAPVHMVRKPGQWFSQSSFERTVGGFSNLGAGSILGPGIDKWDMALAKNTKIAEKIDFQIRVEAFDVFNHPNFGNPTATGSDGISNNIDATNFGQVTGDHEPRILQMGGKIRF